MIDYDMEGLASVWPHIVGDDDGVAAILAEHVVNIVPRTQRSAA
jgi:hypothetical protein